MNTQLAKKILAVSLVISAPLAVFIAQDTFAKDTAAAGATLIDKDFEVALRKFVTKRFYNRIDATDEQRQKLDSLFASTMDETRPLREHFRHSLLDLSTLMASDDATDEQIQTQVQSVRAEKQQIMDKRVTAALAVRKILTHEQRQQVHERLSQLISGGIKPRRLGMLIIDQD